MSGGLLSHGGLIGNVDWAGEGILCVGACVCMCVCVDECEMKD